MERHELARPPGGGPRGVMHRTSLGIRAAGSYHSRMLIPALRALCLLALLSLPPAAAALTSFRAEYDLSLGVVTLGRMSRVLVIDDHTQRYRFESTMETRGLVALFADARVVEVSAGRIEPAGFVPERYSYDKQGTKKDYELEFDYTRNLVRRSDAGDAWEASMPAHLLDKLSYQAQLMFDLDAAPQALRYDIADKSRLKEYHIQVLGSETVETGLGKFDTVKLTREKAGSKRRTVVWCAAALGWMAVKVEHRDKRGAVTTAILRSLHQDPGGAD